MLSKLLFFVALFALVIHATLVAFTKVVGGPDSTILSAWKCFIAILALISAGSGRWIKFTTILAGATVAAMVQLQWHPDLPNILINDVIPHMGKFLTSLVTAKSLDDAFSLIFGVSLMFGDVLLSTLDITASVLVFFLSIRALLLARSARARVVNKAAALKKKTR